MGASDSPTVVAFVGPGSTRRERVWDAMQGVTLGSYFNRRWGAGGQRSRPRTQHVTLSSSSSWSWSPSSDFVVVVVVDQTIDSGSKEA